MSEESLKLKEIQGIQPDLNSYPEIAKHFLYLTAELEKFGAKNPEIKAKVGPYIENAEKLALQAIEARKKVQGELGELKAGIDVGNILDSNISEYDYVISSQLTPTNFLESMAV